MPLCDAWISCCEQDAIAVAQLLVEKKPWYVLIPSGRWRGYFQSLLLIGATTQAIRIPFQLAFYHEPWRTALCYLIDLLFACNVGLECVSAFVTRTGECATVRSTQRGRMRACEPKE